MIELKYVQTVSEGSKYVLECISSPRERMLHQARTVPTFPRVIVITAWVQVLVAPATRSRLTGVCT